MVKIKESLQKILIFEALLLLSLVLMEHPKVLAAYTPGGAGYVKVDDGADLLSSQEEMDLRAQALELEEATGYDYFIITTEDAGGREAREYAEDYYVGHYTTLDGVAYLIDMDNREIYIATSGDMRYYLTDERWETMLDHAYDYVSQGDYSGAFSSMLSDTKKYLNAGVQSGTYTVDENTGEVNYYKEAPSLNMWDLLLGITAALIAGGAIFGITVGNYRMKLGTYSYSFRDNSQLNLRRKEDRLVNRIVTHRHIPRSNPPSGHSGGGGGHASTVHTGSGGHSFGGGGRKF